MNAVLAWFAKNPVAANLLMIVILLGGGLSFAGIRTEISPEFFGDKVFVEVRHPGAAPEEIEQAICVRIEEEVYSIENVKRLTSMSLQDVGKVTIEFDRNTDMQTAMDEVRGRVNAISTFPIDAERAIFRRARTYSTVISLAVAGDVDSKTLRLIGEQVHGEISALPEVRQARLLCAKSYEISVEVDERSLRRYGLGFEDVAAAIRRSSLNLTGGSIKSTAGEFVIRTNAQAYVAEDFENLVVRTNADGSRVMLGDIANVIDGFEDREVITRFDGRPAVLVRVLRGGEGDALSIAKSVVRYLNQKRESLPPGITLSVYEDSSEPLRSRLSLLLRNGLQGLLLVFLVMAAFLRFRLAVWVTLGIPTAFLGAMWLLPGLGVSINMISLFGFILALGIVVDDAIVVGESIHSKQQRSESMLGGAIAGVQAVSKPVTFAFLTTIATFAPMLDLPSWIGRFAGVIATVIMPILLFSWIESKLILPAHLAHESRLLSWIGTIRPFRWWVALQCLIERGMATFAQSVYRPILAGAMRWRYATYATVVATMVLSVGLVEGERVRFTDFPVINGDLASALLRMPVGTSVAETQDAVRRIERVGWQLNQEFEGMTDVDVVQHIRSSIGELPTLAFTRGQTVSVGGDHLAEIFLQLAPTEERPEVLTADILIRWRELCGSIPGAVDLTFDADLVIRDQLSDFVIEISGSDTGELQLAADQLGDALATRKGVFNVSNSIQDGKQEVQLELLPAAESLGLTLVELATQVRQAFYGAEAQRVIRQREEVKVMVRLPSGARRQLQSLQSMRILTPSGDHVPLSVVARAKFGRGASTIERADRKRTVSVTCDVDKKFLSLTELNADLRSSDLPDILEEHPSIALSTQGDMRDVNEILERMIKLFSIALLVIYGLIAVPVRSYLQPLIVMSAIPIGFVGAVYGHLIMGYDLSMFSLMGLVALTGIVVNDSLVMVDYINRARRDSQSLLSAVQSAGVARFRPIVLTSLTTFVGLAPLMSEQSAQAQFMIPMAISLAYGVMFSTIVTLIFVPISYLILEDFRCVWRWYVSPRSSTERSV